LLPAFAIPTGQVFADDPIHPVFNPPGRRNYLRSLLYSNLQYRGGWVMSAEKTVSISFRVSPDLKAKLEAVAAKENRSLTNMFETLVLNHCQREGLTTSIPGAIGQSGAKR